MSNGVIYAGPAGDQYKKWAEEYKAAEAKAAKEAEALEYKAAEAKAAKEAEALEAKALEAKPAAKK